MTRLVDKYAGRVASVWMFCNTYVAYIRKEVHFTNLLCNN